MTRWVQIVHAIPGRTRLRCPELRRDHVACETVADALAARPGVHEVKVRPYTSSVLVLHDPSVQAADLAETARAALSYERVLAIGEAPPRPAEIPELSRIAQLAATAFREIDRDLLAATEGSLDFGTLATLGFFGAGAVEIAVEQSIEMPPWFNLAWWGFRTFVTTEQDEIEADLPA
ncbi:MAG: hypothetical protein JWO36_1076 [Myxococcales bacterium]|nr:hypothetical protein [Myxococcales bacterium]